MDIDVLVIHWMEDVEAWGNIYYRGGYSASRWVGQVRGVFHQVEKLPISRAKMIPMSNVPVQAATITDPIQ